MNVDIQVSRVCNTILKQFRAIHISRSTAADLNGMVVSQYSLYASMPFGII